MPSLIPQPTCRQPGKGGDLCKTCLYSPIQQLGRPVSGKMDPRLTREGGCLSHAHADRFAFTPSAA